MYKLPLIYCFLLETLTLQITAESASVYKTITIETVVILDEGYISYLRSNGHSTNESLYELVSLKWMGVQAEWGRADVFGYDVRIAIKEIVLWETNPTWYNPSTDLDDTLYHMCSQVKSRGLWTDFDFIHLFTGNTNTDGYSGRANTGKMCVNGDKCAVSAITSVNEYVIAAHELGHSMGMGHDGDVGCPSPNDGIMGSRTMGWSSCSVAAFKLLVNSSRAACIFRTDVQADNMINLTEAWPGMVYTNDEICIYKHGAGFRYKANNQNPCSSYMCVNMNQTSRKYGISFSQGTPTDGSYCDENRVCSSQISGGGYQCISWVDTGLDLSLFSKVTANWSSWGSMTSCSRTCGSGVRYRQRLCNNPKPQNSRWCEGNEFDAELCNTKICAGDKSDEAELILQRANETCSFWKENNVYELKGEDSANYLYTGKQYSKTDHGQCEVKCDTVDGYTAAGNGRHGIIPDGTPCKPTQLSSFIEQNNLPRKSGMFGRCVQGYCYLFGCDNKTGSTHKDGCGVCGGDNSTCTIEEGLYDIVLVKGERGTIVRLPTNASMIQFHFIYSDMDKHFLELRTPDTDKGIIIYRTLDTTKDPVKYAGTEWYLLWYKQYLYAQGPTTHEVVIKLYNYGGSINTGVMFAYSLPLADKPTFNTTTRSTTMTSSSTTPKVYTDTSQWPNVTFQSSSTTDTNRTTATIKQNSTTSTVTTETSPGQVTNSSSSTSDSNTMSASTSMHLDTTSPAINTATSQASSVTQHSSSTATEGSNSDTEKRKLVVYVVPAAAGALVLIVTALVIGIICIRRGKAKSHTFGPK